MKSRMINLPSLRVSVSLGSVVWRLIVISIALTVMVELAARRLASGPEPPLESLGTVHPQMELKWFALGRYVQDRGGVDIILLGSSETNTGIVSGVLHEGLLKETGQAMRVFNFGVEGFPVNLSALLIEPIIKTYQPKLIILGTEPRDYNPDTSVELAENILDDAWIKYQNGQFNIKGWFIHHSVAYRQYLAWRNWTKWDFPIDQLDYAERLTKLRGNGYEPDFMVSEDHFLNPDPNDPAEQLLFERYSDYALDTERLDALAYLISVCDAYGVEIVVVETPIAPSFFEYFGNGLEDHDYFLIEIDRLVDSAGAAFIPALSESEIPLDGRANRTHLNHTGALVFTRYVAEQIGKLMIENGWEFGPTIQDGQP